MNHLAILALRRNEGLVHANKSLVSRATGSFYTPEVIAGYLNEQLLPKLWQAGKEISVVDPFAGDGRLVCWLIESAYKAGIAAKWRVALWDHDAAGLAAARRRLEALEIANNVRIDATMVAADSFDLALQHEGQFDVVITNPPWEALKPDSRELSSLGVADRDRYIVKMKAVDRKLATAYPESQPTKKFAGWGTNLSRVGLQASLRLLREGGHLGVVLPASAYADQVSGPLRRWVASRLQLSSTGYFPAEARLFDRVDQASIAMVGTRVAPAEQRFTLHAYESTTRTYLGTEFAFSIEGWEGNDFCIPFAIKGDAQAILSSLEALPTWADLEQSNCGFWAGRELDETGIAAKLTNSGRYPFVKGKMVGRFQFVEQPTKRVAAKNFEVPSSVDAFRVAWRDVSRQTQKRRMQATIVPPGYVTGNSLNVAMFRHQDKDASLALLAVMNSFVFEAQVRARSTTSHISLGSVRRVRIPDVRNARVAARLSAVAQKCLQSPLRHETESEIAVAKEYGIGKEAFAALLPTFPKVTKAEADALLSSHAW